MSATIPIPPEVPSGTFQQGKGSYGGVSLDAENAHVNTPQGGHSWTFIPLLGASGNEAMEATPNTRVTHNTNYTTSMDVQVTFVHTGTHYVKSKRNDSNPCSRHESVDSLSPCGSRHHCIHLQQPDHDAGDGVGNQPTSTVANFNTSPTSGAAPLPAVMLWLEAEEGLQSSLMEIGLDDEASSGRYLWVPEGNGVALDPSQSNSETRYTFTVPTADLYVIWGQARPSATGTSPRPQ